MPMTGSLGREAGAASLSVTTNAAVNVGRGYLGRGLSCVGVCRFVICMLDPHNKKKDTCGWSAGTNSWNLRSLIVLVSEAACSERYCRTAFVPRCLGAGSNGTLTTGYPSLPLQERNQPAVSPRSEPWLFIREVRRFTLSLWFGHSCH